MAFPLSGLVSYWKLDEASGTRVDSHGTNHLTPTNAPVGAAGKIGNGCDFELGSLQGLECPSNATLQVGDTDFTIAAWIKPESLPTNSMVVTKDGGSAREYDLDTAGGELRFYINGGTGGIVVTNNVALTVSTWTFVTAWHDATANTVSIQANNGSVFQAATTVAPPIGTGPFQVGSRPDGYQFDGLIDEVGLWRRVLTAQERTDLYNGGAGLPYYSGPPPVIPAYDPIVAVGQIPLGVPTTIAQNAVYSLPRRIGYLMVQPNCELGQSSTGPWTAMTGPLALGGIPLVGGFIRCTTGPSVVTFKVRAK